MSTRISVVARVARTEISLLQLCRPIRDETVPIFYGNTTFSLDLRIRPNFQRAKSWLHGLSPQAIANLRKVYVHSDVSCCCSKGDNKDTKIITQDAWADADAGRGSQYGYRGCRVCGGEESVKEVARRIYSGARKQKVRSADLEALLEVMRPMRTFDFSFEVARDGEGKATFEATSKLFGLPMTKTMAGSESSLVIREREIKQPRNSRRSGARMSDTLSASPAGKTAE